LAASGELTFALQTVIFYTLYTCNNPLGPRPQLSVLHDSTQNSVYTKQLRPVI